jgi:coenzyme Q-binding protein COQ10
MPAHRERRLLPYHPEQLFDLVADIERYPEFLPWCLAAQIVRRSADGRELEAELSIGFKMLRESYLSRVYLERPHAITVHYVRGPFRHLHNSWRFIPAPQAQTNKLSCWLEFEIDFDFKNRLLAKLMEGLFFEAFKVMVGAFERRARQIYGASLSVSPPP